MVGAGHRLAAVINHDGDFYIVATFFKALGFFIPILCLGEAAFPDISYDFCPNNEMGKKGSSCGARSNRVPTPIVTL